MKTIKISRASIRKNPNAGRTITIVDGLKKGRFVLNQTPPEWLIIQGTNAFATEWGEGWAKGVICSDEAVRLLQTEFGDAVSISIVQEVIEIPHRPEPEYLFEYQNPPIICLNCFNATSLNDIERVDADGDYLLKCGHCGEIDDFEEFEYESIDSALKDKNL